MKSSSNFILWNDEPWGPGRGKIDWSTDYNQEMEVFIEKLLKSIIEDVNYHSSNSVECSDQLVETEGDIGYNQAIEHISGYIRRNYL
jgi:hypothetical protein